MEFAGFKKQKAEAPKPANGFSFGFQAEPANGETPSEDEEEAEQPQAKTDIADLKAQANGRQKDQAQSVKVPET